MPDDPEPHDGPPEPDELAAAWASLEGLLAGEVQKLGRRYTEQLFEARTFWSHTKIAWEYFRLEQRNGRVRELFESMGDDPAAAGEQADLFERAHGNLEYFLQNHLAPAAVQRAVAAFDGFLLGLIRVWLTAHPRALLRSGSNQKTREVPLATVLEAPDREAVIARVVETEVRKRAYGSLTDQIRFLRGLFPAPLEPENEAALVELKATRDVLVHADSIVGRDYIQAVGAFARYAPGERIQLPDAYINTAFDLCISAIGRLADAAAAKAGDAPARG